MKFKTTSDMGKHPKKKAKRNNIRWDAIYANKISFRFINKLLSTFPRFFWMKDTSRSPDHINPGWNTSRATGWNPGIPGSYKQGLILTLISCSSPSMTSISIGTRWHFDFSNFSVFSTHSSKSSITDSRSCMQTEGKTQQLMKLLGQVSSF